MIEPRSRNSESHQFPTDSTFEIHFTITDLVKLWRLGRETVRLLVKNDPEVLKDRKGKRKILTHYSVPESAARRIHNRLIHPDD